MGTGSSTWYKASCNRPRRKNNDARRGEVMPGIFGFAGQSLPTDAPATLARMARLLQHQSWYQQAQHLDEAAGIGLGRMTLGFTDSAVQPATNADRSLL